MEETAQILIFANPILAIIFAIRCTTTTSVLAMLATPFTILHIAWTLTNVLAITIVPLQQTLFAKILLEITRKLSQNMRF